MSPIVEDQYKVIIKKCRVMFACKAKLKDHLQTCLQLLQGPYYSVFILFTLLNYLKQELEILEKSCGMSRLKGFRFLLVYMASSLENLFR